MKAQDFLRKGADLLEERGKQYDQPGGERSMGKAVRAFNTITGRSLYESEGWLLLQILKDVRQWQNPDKYHADSAEDCVSYAALKAESLAVEGGIQDGWTQDAIDSTAFTGAELHAAGLGPRDVLGNPLPCNSPVRGIYVDPYDEPAASIDDDSARAQVVQQNGEMAVEVYAVIDDAPSWDDAPEWAEWLAQDANGEWNWYLGEPVVKEEHSAWFHRRHDDHPTVNRHEIAIRLSANPNWRDTLQARPTKEA